MTPVARSAHTLAATTLRGILWAYLSLALTRGGGLLSTIVLARLLSPADFGVVAFAMLAVDLVGMTKDAGLGAALISEQEDVDAAADTVFTLQLLLTVVLAAICVAIAPLAARWAEAPVVASLVRWLAWAFVVEAIGAVHVARLRHSLDFRRKTQVDAVRAIVKLLVSVAAALAGAGPHALVFGVLAGQLAGSLAAWRRFPWVPHLRVDRSLVARLVGFGGRLTMADMLGVLAERVEWLVIATVLGTVALGTYHVAGRIPMMLATNLLWVTASVLFPAFARLQGDSGRQRAALLDTVRFSAMVYVPVALGTALAADPLVRVLFGAQWIDGIPVLRLLALAALALGLGFHTGDLLKGLGRGDLLLRLAVLECLLLAGGAWLGAAHGLVGVAAGRLIAAGIASTARVAATTRVIGLPAAAYVAALVPAGIAGVALAAVTAAVLAATPPSPVVRLLAAGAAGAGAYGLVLWWWDGTAIVALWRRRGRVTGVAASSEGHA